MNLVKFCELKNRSHMKNAPTLLAVDRLTLIGILVNYPPTLIRHIYVSG